LTSAIPSLNEHRIGDLRPDRMRLVSKKTIVPFDWRMVAPMMPIIIAFGLVLLISCANIANLLLARATARQQEVAVRVALGAGRGRLIHQLLTESTLLALGGGLLGFAFAHWIMTIVSKEVLPRVPTKGLLLVREIDVDSHAFLYVLALACVTGLLFGLAPRSQRLVLMCRRR